MHRFFLTPEQLQPESFFLPEQIAHQVSKVLRLAPGEQILLLDNVGSEYLATLTAVDRHKVQVKINGRQPAGGEPQVHLTLYQSLLKLDKFEWVLQKGTELGVSCFVPVITQRSVVHEPSPNKLARWQRIALEAAEQCRRGRVPVIAPPIKLAEAFAGGETLKLLPWEADQHHALADYLPKRSQLAKVALFIGPEGGWSEEEVALAQTHAIAPITLGQRILRAETAALVAISLVMYELGELQASARKPNGEG